MNETFLTLHIGSSAIRGTLTKMEAGVPAIIFSEKEMIAYREEVEGEHLWHETKKAIDILIRKLFKARLQRPDKIYCVLSSPWYISELRSLRLNEDAPLKFTNQLASDLLKKEAEIFTKENLHQYGDLEQGIMEPVEMKTIRTYLNGYETTSPFDQKAKEIKMDIFISLAPRENLNVIKEIIHRHFPMSEIHFSTFAFASFMAARDMFPEEDFLLVSVDGEITDISMIKKAGIVAQASFPLGINGLSRVIGGKIGKSLPEASTLISVALRGHAAPLAIKKLESSVNIYRDKWIEGFEETLSRFSQSVSIPHSVFLVTDDVFQNFFSETISYERIHQYAWTEKKFKIKQLPIQMLLQLSLKRFV
ncbi:MAG TPA: hypothetical protein VFQ59_01060 [Candidatus Paceibacterota bacterium]|nr:hypothetical protein [Candidatus Paceibacterota bacterium]